MPKPKMVAEFDPKSPATEAYRILRTNIDHADMPTPAKALLVTSAHPGEGKTTTALNLAVTWAEIGRRILLVDADVRRPALHGEMGLEKSRGLTEVLRRELKWDDVLKPSGVQNLSVITSGEPPENPSQILGSKMIEQFVDEVKSYFDIVLFDSPAVLVVTDAAVLSSLVDGVLLVVMAEKTPREAVQRALALLNNVKSNIMGVVLNGLHVGRSDAYYHYRYDSEPRKESQQ